MYNTDPNVHVYTDKNGSLLLHVNPECLKGDHKELCLHALTLRIQHLAETQKDGKYISK